MGQRVCFVIMGFGSKTDHSSSPARTLNLDATYSAIIRPAVVAAGLDCVRADEISHAGVIDKVMFEMLLRADLVIADISTANPNALYELGVRHALRPRTTIVMKELDGKFMFDLNHLATIQYKHLGEDIGWREAQRCSEALTAMIGTILARGELDSPVYTFLRGLQEPALSTKEFADSVRSAVAQSDSLANAIQLARAALKESPSNHVAASRHFARALEMQTHPHPGRTVDPDPYLVQQVALHTYKAKVPTPLNALEAAWKHILVLRPETSTDPETLGIAGAIQKGLWDRTEKREHLELAIEHYGRAFEVRRDYYTGENYAFCLGRRAAIEPDGAEAAFTRRTAEKVLARVLTHLAPQLAEPTARERADYPWMLATMANVGNALGRADASEYEVEFRKLASETWMIDTFESGKKRALTFREAP